MARGWNRSDVELEQFWERAGEQFRVIGICDEPTVIVENVATGKQEHHAITCLNFAKFNRPKSERPAI